VPPVASKYHGDKWVSSDKWEWEDINSKHGSKHGKDGKDGLPGKVGATQSWCVVVVKGNVDGIRWCDTVVVCGCGEGEC